LWVLIILIFVSTKNLHRDDLKGELGSFKFEPIWIYYGLVGITLIVIILVIKLIVLEHEKSRVLEIGFGFNRKDNRIGRFNS